MSNMYQEQIIEHYHNPQNWGDLSDPDVTIVGNNPLCGDTINLKLKIRNLKLTQIKFVAQGCAISVASASLLTENLKGKGVNEILNYSKDQVIELLGIELTPIRLRCALLSLDTIKSALRKYAQD